VQAELGNTRAMLGDEVSSDLAILPQSISRGPVTCFDSILTASDLVLLMHGSSGYHD
jgi:hypothetical protein